MKARNALAAAAAMLISLGAAPALAAPDYDGDGVVAGDCQPLDPAVFPGAPDEPDLAFEDLNCDGVDGNPATAFFVATTGNDVGATGSLAVPFRNIQTAVDAASVATPKRAVYVLAGIYSEHLDLADGVSIYGGYTPAGGRSSSDPTAIQAPGFSEAVLADGDVGVELQQLTIVGPDTASPNASSYAIRAINGSALALTGITATGGAAGSGTSGGLGSPGLAGAAGTCGGLSEFGCGVSSVGGEGGLGGSGAGSKGGKGADGPTWGGSGGVYLGAMGASGSGNTPGGGGAAGQPQVFGGNCPSDSIFGPSPCHGGAGQKGTDQPDGTAGSSATFDPSAAGTQWEHGSGATGGSSGTTAGGGGGGGSGAIQSSGTSCSTVASHGGAGGGGGGGGTGGTAGQAGGNGGGSFGAYVHASSVVVDRGAVRGGVAGNGGSGGDGGTGGNPGTGANGSPKITGTGCTAFSGGRGGDGGRGGHGGGGGGGAGGPSIGVFATATSSFAVRPNTTVEGGAAGAGGQKGAGGTGNGNGAAGPSAGTLAQSGANGTSADFDADGKADADDACPAVAANSADGCRPRAAKLPDGDGDGIPDGTDACPAQAGGATDIDGDGCPNAQARSDRDGDGFPDDQDCAPTDPKINFAAAEVPGNAVDENCDRIVAPFPKLRATFDWFGFATAKTNRFTRLIITNIPAGAVVELRCSGKRCPFKAEKVKVAKGKANALTILPKRRRKRGITFRVGNTLDVRVTAPGLIGAVARFKMTRKRFPKAQFLCLPPGAAKPGSCG